MFQTRTVAGPAFLRAVPLSAKAQLVLLLGCHLLLWAWVGWSSRSNFDAPGDMVEAYVWAQGWQWGYYKHPPLSAWLAGLWFSVVPESQLGYSLLTALNGTVGLAGLALLAREFLPARWVLLAVALASLAPGLTTIGMRFNANAVLISTWPLAIALFVRLMQRGRTLDAVLCGAMAALAMLGKYYSAVLLLSLLATALWLPAWRARLWSGPFLLAVVTFVLCFAPHANWLLAQSHGPLQYAQAATGQQSAAESTMRALHFALVQGVFPVLALLALGLALEGPLRGRAFVGAVTAPLRPRNDAVWLLAVLPVLATMAVTVATGARTAWVWGLAIAAGLALLAAQRAQASGARLNLRRLWATLGTIWIVVALLSPLWWHARALLRLPSVTEPRAELAHALSSTWQASHHGSLPWVTGTRALAASVSFYAPGHPRYWSLWSPGIETPWVNTAEVQSQGGVIVCAVDDLGCQSQAEAWSADRQPVSVAKSVRGFLFDAQPFVVYWMLPQLTPMAQSPPSTP